MNIGRETKKKLWKESGNCCAICKNKLEISSNNNSTESLQGYELLITETSLNNYYESTSVEYLLLCKHDFNYLYSYPESFTDRVLLIIKKEHEQWVRSMQNKDDDQKLEINKDLEYLNYINCVGVLKDTINGIDSFLFDTNTSKGENHNLIESLFEKIKEYSEKLDNEKELAQLNTELKSILEKLINKGFKLYGKSIKRKMINNEEDQRSILNIGVLVMVDKSISLKHFYNNRLTYFVPEVIYV
ncbi:hypothetical protein [Myroides injenensis]|uniref:hypothetical protein n=1 Tax=Myroides injenensis TaxID=1183151 RepID=UPI000287BD53|nr:hypothetical protein [Myroides injenensis]